MNRKTVGSALVALAVAAGAGLSAHGAAGRTGATAPSNNSPPTISGTAKDGSTLTASSGSWAGTTPMTFSYHWQRCDSSGGSCADIGSATKETYTVAGADVGHTLRVQVTAKNGGGSASAVSAATAQVAAADAPVNTTLPSISGTARQGETLTGSNGSWSGTAPIKYTGEWRRCDTTGANCSTFNKGHSTYTLTSRDVGHTIRFRVTATNAGGSAQALSSPTAVVSQGAAPANTSLPTISGTLLQGKTLSASSGGWTGSGISFSYAWQRCDANAGCKVIDGARGTTYTLTAADVTWQIRVVVTAKNSFGSVQATSKETGLVQGPPSVAALPSISGTAAVGAKLTGSVGTWHTVTSVTYAYQWTRCAANGTACAAIPGATGATYIVAGADLGHTIVLQVKATNSLGSSWANSQPTAVVGGAAVTTGVLVSSVALPDRLVVDQVKFNRISSRAQPFVMRFHVKEVTHGRSVTGALVYATGVPFNHLSRAPEATTDARGWATVTFSVLRTQPVRRGSLIVVFVRARKPGDSVLAGVSTRRLVAARIA